MRAIFESNGQHWLLLNKKKEVILLCHSKTPSELQHALVVEIWIIWSHNLHSHSFTSMVLKVGSMIGPRLWRNVVRWHTGAASNLNQAKPNYIVCLPLCSIVSRGSWLGDHGRRYYDSQKKKRVKSSDINYHPDYLTGQDLVSICTYFFLKIKKRTITGMRFPDTQDCFQHSLFC